MNPGVIVGIITAEGQRRPRIDNRQGETIWVSYRVYNGRSASPGIDSTN